MSETGKIFGITEGMIFVLILFYASASFSFSLIYVLVGLFSDALANAVSIFNERDMELQEKLNLYKVLFHKEEKPRLLERKGRKETALTVLRVVVFTLVGGLIVLLPAFYSLGLDKILAPIITIAVGGYISQSVEKTVKDKLIAITKFTLSILIVLFIIFIISFALKVNPA